MSNLISKEDNELLRSIKQSFLQTEVHVKSLNLFLKFIFFENEKYHQVTIRDLEGFTEDQMGASGGSEMDGMMGNLLSSLLGGGEGSTSGGEEGIEKLMKSIMV